MLQAYCDSKKIINILYILLTYQFIRKPFRFFSLALDIFWGGGGQVSM